MQIGLDQVDTVLYDRHCSQRQKGKENSEKIQSNGSKECLNEARGMPHVPGSMFVVW